MCNRETESRQEEFSQNPNSSEMSENCSGGEVVQVSELKSTLVTATAMSGGGVVVRKPSCKLAKATTEAGDEVVTVIEEEAASDQLAIIENVKPLATSINGVIVRNKRVHEEEDDDEEENGHGRRHRRRKVYSSGWFKNIPCEKCGYCPGLPQGEEELRALFKSDMKKFAIEMTRKVFSLSVIQSVWSTDQVEEIYAKFESLKNRGIVVDDEPLLKEIFELAEYIKIKCESEDEAKSHIAALRSLVESWVKN